MGMPAIDCGLCLVALLNAATLSPEAENSAALDEPPTAWDRMFRRDEPREFSRFPIGVEDYILDAGGWYLQLTSTTVWQGASRSKNERRDLLTSSYSLASGWQAIEKGYFSFWIRGGQPIGAPRDADLSNDIGSLLGVNGSREDDAIYLKEFYWAHQPWDQVWYSLGAIDSSYRFDFNAAANDESASFLSGALVNSPAIPFPDTSYAADVHWNREGALSLHAGLYQTNCERSATECLDKLSSREYFAPVELTLNASPRDWGEGHYRILAFKTERGGQSGSGWSLSMDQTIGRWMPFARVSRSDRNIADVRRFYSLGLALNAPAGRRFDTVAIGVARGQPSDRKKRTETLVEWYWKVRINPYVTITPVLQWIADPSNQPQADTVFVGGARLQLDF